MLISGSFISPSVKTFYSFTQNIGLIDNTASPRAVAVHRDMWSLTRGEFLMKTVFRFFSELILKTTKIPVLKCFLIFLIKFFIFLIFKLIISVYPIWMIGYEMIRTPDKRLTNHMSDNMSDFLHNRKTKTHVNIYNNAVCASYKQ